MKHLIHSLLLIFPVAVAGILHMVAVKSELLPQLKIPINQSVFGQNKTLRGLLLMPLFTALASACLPLIDQLLTADLKLNIELFEAIQLGFWLGLSYIIFELPNSYIKRKIGIPPGESPKKHKLFFRVTDRLDSTLGCLLVFYLFLDTPLKTLVMILLMGILVHACITNILFVLRIRKEKW